MRRARGREEMFGQQIDAASLVAELVEHEKCGRRWWGARLRLKMLRAARMASLSDARLLLESLATRQPLVSNTCQEPAARRFGHAVLNLAEARLGPDDIVTARARVHLAHAGAFGRPEEGVALLQAALPILERHAPDRGEINVERGNLELWLRRSGRVAEADAARDLRWQSLLLCEHLQPAEDYITSRGVPVRERGVWGGVLVAVEAFFDGDKLRSALKLDPAVEPVELDDIHHGRAQGLRCAVHGDSILGHHAKDKSGVPDVT